VSGAGGTGAVGVRNVSAALAKVSYHWRQQRRPALKYGDYGLNDRIGRGAAIRSRLQLRSYPDR